MKSLYRHKRSGDVFAIETNEAGLVIATGRLSLNDELPPQRCWA